jgi:DNA-binding transcriptional LysR family regulator
MVRSPKGIELTAAGVALLAEGRNIVEQIDKMSHSVRELATRERQTLRVGLICGTVAAADLTIPILQEFSRRHPHVDLAITDLTLAEQFDAVLDDAVDVAIVRPPCTDERIETTPLFAEPRVLCCSKDHPLANGTDVEFADVFDEPMIELVNAPESWRSYWMLDDLRVGPPSSKFKDSAVTLSQLHMSLTLEQVTMPAASSAWRMSLQSPPLSTIDVPPMAPSQVAVAYRQDQNKAHASAFTRCARDVSEALIGLVPGATLLPT